LHLHLLFFKFAVYGLYEKTLQAEFLKIRIYIKFLHLQPLYQ